MRWNNHRLALLLLAGLVSCGSDNEPQAESRMGDSWAGRDSSLAYTEVEVPAGSPRVVFLGDSLSAGLHLESDQAFPAVLQRRMIERGLPFDLVNAGVSGDTTAGGLARIDWILKQAPDVVVVELGGNDGLRGLSVAQIEENLRGILTRIRDAGAEPILFGMRLPPSYGAEYVRDFRALYAELAREFELPTVLDFLDGVGGVARFNLPDGIHPNAEGHERLADNIEDVLAEVLEDLE